MNDRLILEGNLTKRNVRLKPYSPRFSITGGGVNRRVPGRGRALRSNYRHLSGIPERYIESINGRARVEGLNEPARHRRERYTCPSRVRRAKPRLIDIHIHKRESPTGWWRWLVEADCNGDLFRDWPSWQNTIGLRTDVKVSGVLRASVDTHHGVASPERFIGANINVLNGA